MYKDVLRAIDGVSIFPVVSLLMFIVFFTIILVVTLRYTKENESELAILPLEDEPVNSIDKTKNHNHV